MSTEILASIDARDLVLGVDCGDIICARLRDSLAGAEPWDGDIDRARDAGIVRLARATVARLIFASWGSPA